MSLKIGSNGLNYEALNSIFEAGQALAEEIEQQKEMQGVNFEGEASEVLETGGGGGLLVSSFQNDVGEVLRKRALFELVPKEEPVLNTGPLFVEPRDNFLPKLSLPKGMSIEDQHAGLRPPLYVRGPYDVNEVDMNDVDQQELGNCWMMAPLAELAKQDPDAIKRMIKDNGDGTYTVTFKERIPVLGSADIVIDRPITVSGDLFKDVQVLPYLKPIAPHGNPGDKNARGQGEIWPLIIEKAYAQYKGNYSNYFYGGNATEFMQALTGKATTEYSPIGGPMFGGATFEQLKSDFESGKNVVFCTHGNNPTGDYRLVPNHCYALSRIYTDSNGRKMVELYNPWKRHHPMAMTYEEACRYMDQIITN